MVVGVTRSCYSAPCRWYAGGPIGKIRYYFANPGALWLPFKTCFWGYSQFKQLQNATEPGEITGPGLRTYYLGTNVNDLPGLHYEGTAADFRGHGVP